MPGVVWFACANEVASKTGLSCICVALVFLGHATLSGASLTEPHFSWEVGISSVQCLHSWLID